MCRNGILILAAGGSSRLGKPKQLLAFKDEALLEHVTNIALQCEMSPVVVVVGAFSDKCSAVLDGLPVRIVENPAWIEGMASSLRVGIAALKDDALDGVVIMLCDQPLVSVEVIQKLVSTGQPIAVSHYEGNFGPPAFFSNEFFDELLDLQGDCGAKQILHKHADKVARVEFSDGLYDVDTPADYVRLITSGD